MSGREVVGNYLDQYPVRVQYLDRDGRELARLTAEKGDAFPTPAEALTVDRVTVLLTYADGVSESYDTPPRPVTAIGPRGLAARQGASIAGATACVALGHGPNREQVVADGHGLIDASAADCGLALCGQHHHADVEVWELPRGYLRESAKRTIRHARAQYGSGVRLVAVVLWRHPLNGCPDEEPTL